MEEAKKNMYAFSTTTYTGFQCTVDEETSEKFKGNPRSTGCSVHNRLFQTFFIALVQTVLPLHVGLPGVLWVLPDSYIDVKNKDYGG